MRIFNENKTQEVFNPDLSVGRLQDEKLFVKHHEAQEYIPRQSHYDVIKTYENGGQDLAEIVDIEEQFAQDAYDEYEDIQVYIPYTDEELRAIHKNVLRYKRVVLLEAFDKWEKAVLRGRENDSEKVMKWYNNILNLIEYDIDNPPEEIVYYLANKN